MKRLRRWLAIATLVILVVAIAGFLFLHSGTVRSRALAYTIRELESRFNLTLTAADLRYNLLTRTASLSDIRLAARGHAAQPFFTARQVRVALPIAVFRGRLAFDRLEVDDGRVDVVRNAQGISNLPPGGGGAPLAQPRRLTVHGLLVGSLDFTLDDQEHDVAIAARGVTADLRQGGPLGDISGPFAITSGVTVRWRDRTLKTAPIASVMAFEGSAVAFRDLPLQAREMNLLIGGRIDRVLDAPLLDLTIGGTAHLAPATEWVATPVPVAGSAAINGTMKGRPSEFTLALDVNGRDLTVGRADAVSVSGPIELTPDQLTSGGVVVQAGPRGSIKATLGVPFGDDRPARITAELQNLDARTAVALANLDSPAVGASLSGGLDFTPGADLQLTFGITATQRTDAGVTPVSGTASGVIADDRWELTHDLALPGLAAEGKVAGRFDRETPSRSSLGGASNLVVTNIGVAMRALEPLGVSVPQFVRELEGTVKAPARLAGTFDDPHVTASVEADQLQVPSLGRLDVGADLDITRRLVTVSPLFASRFSTVANGQVTIDLTTKALAGTVRVMTTNAADLQTAVPLEWQLEGPLTAIATIGGTTTNPVVDVEADGTKNLLRGQALDAVHARVHITPDGARVDELQLQQGGGRIESTGTYGWDTRAYTATVDGKGLSWRGALLGDAESLVTLSAHFEGAGTIDRPAGEGRAEFSLSGGAAGDLVGDGTLDVVLDGQDARLRGVVPSLGALVTGTVGLSSPMPYRFVGVLNRVDLAKLVPLAGIATDVVKGQASLSVAANGELIADDNGAHPQHLGPQLFANLQTLDATVGDVPITLTAPARIGWQDDELTVTGLDAIVGKGKARASGTWATRTGTVFEGSYSGELGDLLGIARAFDLPADVTGQGQVTIAVQSAGDPSTASATLVMEKGRIAFRDAPVLNDLQVQAAFRNETLSISRIAGSVSSEQITGAFEATGRASVKSFDLAGIDGEVVFDRAGFDVARIPVDQQRPTRISLKGGVVEATDVAWSVAESPVVVTGTVTLGDSTALDLGVKGTTDLRVVTAFVPGIGVDGTAELDVRVAGTPDTPDLNGTITLKDAEIALPNPRAIIGDLSGPILLNGREITIPAMRGSANGGDISIEGALELVGGELGGQILAQATGVALEFPRGLRSEADFILTFTPGPGTPRLIGDVRIQRASFTETISLAALARGRTVAPPRPSGAAGPSFVDRLAINISIDTVEDMVVDNNYGRFDTGASVRVVGTVASPGMTGRISLREGGEVYLAGRTFRINRGEISFTELNRIAPEFNIEAQARVDRDDLTMRLTGPVDKPEFELSSSSRDRTGEELAASLVGGDNTGQSALTLLTSDLLGVTGRAIGLNTLRIDQVETFDSDFREDPTLIATDTDPATRLTISKRLRDDVEVTVSQNLRDNGQTTIIVSYFILQNFEIRAISTDDEELGIGLRHQLSFGGPAGAVAAARAAQPTVTAIRFEGDPAPLQEAAIRKTHRLKEGEPFNFYDWQRDIDEIREAYIEQRHFEARVRARRGPVENDPSSITLEYRLEPGPRTELEIRGIELPSSETRAMEEAWSRAVFDRFLMDDLENRVRRHLVTSGQIEGTVEGRLTEEGGVKRAVLSVDPGPSADGREIRFTGNTAIAPGRLAEAVTAAGLDVDAWLDPQQLVPVLRAFYRDQGFLTATVQTGVPHLENGRGVLPVTIVEGSGSTITEIALTGVAEARRAEMREALAMTAPTVYDSARVIEARDRLERAYRTRGFNSVEIATDSKVDPANTSIALTFAVEEGPQQILREVITSGATRTREGVVSRALDLPVDAPVNLEEWARARKRLYDTNVFRQVDVVAEPMSDPAGGIQPVRARVSVVEYPVWRFRYGLQLEGERSAFTDGTVGADELGVIAEIKNQNLLGRAVTGGIFGRYEKLAQDATVFASNASFFGLPIRSSLFGFFTRDKFRGDPNDPERVVAITDRIGTSFEQRIRQRGIQFTYAYRFETNRTFDPEPAPGDDFPLDVRSNLARISGAVILDRRSDLLDARTGTFSAVSLEYAAPLLGSDIRYTKLLAQQHFFTVPVAGLVLASRAQFGNAWHSENLLRNDRFLAGGATSVRGYPEDSLGPYDVFGLPRGGGQMLILNQELRFPVYRWFGGVAFIDAGNVFDQQSPFAWSELKIGYGAGLRLSTPIGVLRMDMGIPGSAVAGLPTVRPNSFASRRWYFGLGHVY